MTIELLDRYRELTGNQGVGSPLDLVCSGKATQKQWLAWRRSENVVRARRELVIRFTWSVPTPEAVAAIAELSPIIDPMAGNGYWPHLLEQAGADVVAFDRLPAGCDLHGLIFDGDVKPDENLWHAEAAPWFRVERGDAPTVAAEHADRTLLLSWPPMSGVGDATEDAYWKAGGRRLVYIGEPGEGCTGDGLLHARLGWPPYCGADHDNPDDMEWCRCGPDEPQRWEQVGSVSLPQWDGMRDGVFIFERKEGL